MATKEKGIGSQNSPEEKVEGVLWELGKEHPECREVICGVVAFLRARQKRNLHQDSADCLANPEMNEFADLFLRAYELKKPMTVADCAKKAGVSNKTIYVVMDKKLSFFEHIKSMSSWKKRNCKGVDVQARRIFEY